MAKKNVWAEDTVLMKPKRFLVRKLNVSAWDKALGNVRALAAATLKLIVCEIVFPINSILVVTVLSETD